MYWTTVARLRETSGQNERTLNFGFTISVQPRSIIMPTAMVADCMQRKYM